MIFYMLRGLLKAVTIFVAVTALTFWLFLARGGDAVASGLLPPQSTPAEVHAAAKSFGLLRPVYVQYFEWLGHLMTGHGFGDSFISGQPVGQLIIQRAPVTFSLIIVSLILTIALAIPVGVGAATRGGVIDRGLQLLSVLVQAVPGYWLALILVIIFGLTLRLVPATGYVPITVSFPGWLSTIILPATAIALGSVAFFAMQIRGAMLDQLRRDYIRTLRSRGIGDFSLIFRHALRNAAPGILTLLGLQIIGIVGGAVIVEQIYALPGLGSLALTSGQSGDLPVVLATVAVVVLIVVVVNLLTDIVNGFVNPKARIR
jgi:peptide/nickel transport system permease protein